ncbi:MAG TPA: hypothetical protein ENI90_08450, partial [Methylothermaceae bacterium]|nr:hypothetical protein [Methylothermaceae bacterium]
MKPIGISSRRALYKKALDAARQEEVANQHMIPEGKRTLNPSTAKKFILHSDFEPAGDQPEAIAQLICGLQNGELHQTLLGVTGS